MQNKFGKWFKLLSIFFTGQIALQFLTAVAGFLIIRFLSKKDYADFSVAFAFQTTMGILVDIGFSNSIVALVRDRVKDDSVIFGYIEAALTARKWLLIIISFIGAIVYFVLSMRNKKSIPEFFWFYSGILFFIFNQKYVILLSYYRIKNMMKEIYIAQIYVFLFRILLIVILQWFSVMTGVVALWLGSLQCALLGYLIGKNIKMPAYLAPLEMQKNLKEMLAFLKPQMPGAIFYAFQGQIIIGIIAYFGNSSAVADTAAVGRFAQLFMLIGAFTSVIIEPFFARIDLSRVIKFYILITLGYLFVCLFLMILVYYFSSFALLILGNQYRGLEFPLQIAVVSGCVSQATVLFWVLNTSRHWNYPWVYIAIIVTTIFSQIFLCRKLDISSVTGVMLFQLWSSLIAMVIHLGVGLSELWKIRLSSQGKIGSTRV